MSDAPWMAYWPDNSGPPVFFATEVEALRHALDMCMRVKQVEVER